jgi:hypothetical protein
MISMQPSQDHRPIELCAGPHVCRERCQRQVAEAEKEMGAFVIAVERMRGAATAARAAEIWVELAEGAVPPSSDGLPNWRQLTVLASMRLAADSCLDNF